MVGFRDRLRKFQPGAEYMEASLENLELKMKNVAPGLETFATDGTAYWHWQNGLTERSGSLNQLLCLSLFLRGNTEVKSKRMPSGPSRTADTYVVEIWVHGISWRRRS